MKILVTGAGGQLGKELLKQGRKSDFELIATDYPQLDITDKDSIAKYISRCKPVLIINSAAYTNVDNAETEQETAFQINRDGPANLAEICANAGIALIHISTDYVFDGKKNIPYIETDPISPIGIYARSKADGEEQVRARLSAHIILRTSWMYGVYGQNFVKTMLRLAAEKSVIKVVDDQFGSPTSAHDLAQAVLKIASDIQQKPIGKWGTYHYCGKGITSWYGFAEKIFILANQYEQFNRPRLEPVSTDQYPTIAQRPPFSALDCSLINKTFSIRPRPWQKSLKSTIDRMIRHGD